MTADPKPRKALRRTRIRQLRPGEDPPSGDPKRYTSDPRGYVRLRWKVGPAEYVETYEHRLVAGLPAADVHHRDEDKANNELENLEPLSRADHARQHCNLRGRIYDAPGTKWFGYRSKYAWEKAERAKARRRERQEFIIEVARLYRLGNTTTEIGEIVGRDASGVSRALRSAGVVARTGGGGKKVPGVSPQVRQVVQARARLRCERCGASLVWSSGHVHHRRPRGMGGDPRPETNQPANLLLLCHGAKGCHEWAERHRDEARRLGFLVRSSAVPSTVPVVLSYGEVLLDNDGGWVRA